MNLTSITKKLSRVRIDGELQETRSHGPLEKNYKIFTNTLGLSSPRCDILSPSNIAVQLHMRPKVSNSNSEKSRRPARDVIDAVLANMRTNLEPLKYSTLAPS